jgi:hypothetical protein
VKRHRWLVNDPFYLGFVMVAFALIWPLLSPLGSTVLTPAARQAQEPFLTLYLSGALAESVVLDEAEEFAEASCGPAGFTFRSDPATVPLGFTLSFQGGFAAAQGASRYVLAPGMAPLNLDVSASPSGEAESFSFSEGTVMLERQGGNFSAFALDHVGQTLYVSGSFSCPAALLGNSGPGTGPWPSGSR